MSVSGTGSKASQNRPPATTVARLRCTSLPTPGRERAGSMPTPVDASGAVTHASADRRRWRRDARSISGLTTVGSAETCSAASRRRAGGLFFGDAF